MTKKAKVPESTPTPAGAGLFPIWVGVGVAVAMAGGLLLFAGRPGNSAPSPQPQAVQAPGPATGAPVAQASNPAAAQEPMGDLAPDFMLTDVSTGKNFRLSEQRGKVVLIDFWATWCGPCRMAIPHLVELQNEYKSKGATIVGVSLDQQGPGVVKPFYKQWKMNYPVVVDDQGEVARNYGGIRSIPTAVLIGKDGRIITGFVGYRPKSEFEKAIKDALAKG